MIRYEKHDTYTEFSVSLGEKLAISTFINTAFTTFFAKVIIFDGGIQSVGVYFGEGRKFF